MLVLLLKAVLVSFINFIEFDIIVLRPFDTPTLRVHNYGIEVDFPQVLLII